MSLEKIAIGDQVEFTTNTNEKRVGCVIGIVSPGLLMIECPGGWRVYRLDTDVTFLSTTIPPEGETEAARP